MKNIIRNSQSVPWLWAVCFVFLLGIGLYVQAQDITNAVDEPTDAAPLRDPFNASLEQVGMPIYAFGGGGNGNSVYSDLIKIKVLALGENDSGDKRVFLQLPKGEIISVSEEEWFTIQGTDLRITPITIKEISDSRLVVLVDKRSQFILR